jgi:hypothetical protein
MEFTAFVYASLYEIFNPKEIHLAAKSNVTSLNYPNFPESNSIAS